MKKANFSMAFHCYQPVFNFDWEIENAYRNAYLPLLLTLKDFPNLKASFHFSGNMLEWLKKRHPAYIKMIRELLQEKQLELISGGCFEPIMPLIPERDRIEQLRLNEKIIMENFGIRPQGAWIAERVWGPELLDTLAGVGIKYTIVDDNHLLCAGIKKEELFKPFLTYGKKKELVLFPSLAPLRYCIPFRAPIVTLDYIKRVLRDSREDNMCFFFADDGEKFGSWPHTYKWVHKKGWLRKFFELLSENSDWLKTRTYAEILDTIAPLEIEMVPESSYSEMMEWSEGNFKNFLKKYPEINRMHKRMMFVSDMIDKAYSNSTGADLKLHHIAKAKEELFKAQTSCAYWHGAFGGFYLPHLRSGVYKHLIRAQAIIENINNQDTKCVRAVKHDLGGNKDETAIGNNIINVFIKSFEGGSISEIDYKRHDTNLMNTISRIKERYHKKLENSYSQRINCARAAVLKGEPVDIHDVLGVAERGLDKILVYDDYNRHSFLTHILADNKPWKSLAKIRTSYDSFLKGIYASCTEVKENSISCILSRRDKIFIDNSKSIDLEVIKKVTVGESSTILFSHDMHKHSGEDCLLRYAVEFNILIWDKYHSSRPRLVVRDRFFLRDRYSDLKLDFSLNKKFSIFSYPLYTVNETEKGLRKTFQGLSIVIGSEYSLQAAKEQDAMQIALTVA